VLQKPKQLKS